jgi:hypothetical protein
MRTILIVIGLISGFMALAQDAEGPGSRKIEFPDIPGYYTLKCDFHQHTVFSDGSVWPNIRIQEALRDGLDAVSITDHIEYQPHQDDIPHPDRNRSYQIAVASAKNTELIVINGSEITRNMPPGHANAIFLQDANALLVDDPFEVFRAAKKQGAFIFWNHPHWTAQAPDGIARLTDMHKELLKEGLLDGIEVVNESTYSDEALQIALDHDLAIMGTSDIHGLIDWDYHVPHGGHRPVTLVFSEERSEAGIREGLENRRTVVWHDNLLVGRPDFLLPLIDASLEVVSAGYLGNTSVLAVTIENKSDVIFMVWNRSDYNLHKNADVFLIKANDITRIEVKTLEILEGIEMNWEILNAVVAPDTHAQFNIKIAVN